MNRIMPFAPERERFVADLIAYMTLEEKLGQLDLMHSAEDPGLEAAIAGGRVGGVSGPLDLPGGAHRLQALATGRSRLGIPLLLIAAPAPHPALSPWALAASWDAELAGAVGAAAAETALRGGANCMAAPLLALDPAPQQSGPAHIASSEPWLAARLAAAFGEGAWNATNGGGKGAGDGGGGALAITTCTGADSAAAQRIALAAPCPHQPAAIDCPALEGEIARRAGFDGIMLAECRRITSLLAKQFARTSTRTVLEAAERAIADGRMSEQAIDEAVHGVLAVKHALGLFRDPDRRIAEPAARTGREAGEADRTRRTMVLLRNEAGLLPLAPVSDRLLVVGALDGAGGECAQALNRAGIGFSAAPGLAIRAHGEDWATPVVGDHFALALTRDAARRSDFVLLALDQRHFERASGGIWQTPTPAALALVQAVSGAGSRVAAIVATAEPVDLGDADQHFAAVLQCWAPGAGFAEALGDILSGRHGPQGRMPVAAGRFPFGHGLGFGECVFSAYTLGFAGDHVAAAARVRNAGSFAARETVQIYVRGDAGDLRLAAFDHVTAAPGEDVPVRFELGLAALGVEGTGGRLEIAPGRHEILLGKSMARLLSAEVELSPAQARAITTGRPQLRAVG